MVQSDVMSGLSWWWIGFALTVQPLLGLAAAILFWRGAQMTFGNIIGTALVFASAMGLILREYVELDRLSQACLDAGTVCWPTPSAFTRFAIYAFIALIEVFALFSLSLVVDERVRRRNYSAEWR
jgi:hypothetical protein